MAHEKWFTYDCMHTPSIENPLYWMDGGTELKFTSTKQLMKYLRTTLVDREWKSISFRTINGRGIEIKCCWKDW